MTTPNNTVAGLPAALSKVRARAEEPGTLQAHGPKFAEGMRCAANMIERKCADALASPAPSAGVVDDAIKVAAMRCARRAYGFWRGGDNGSGEALQYFDGGYAGRERDATMYEAEIREALSQHPAAPSVSPAVEGGLPSLDAFQDAMEAAHGYRPQVFATGVLMNSRDADRFEGWELARRLAAAAAKAKVTRLTPAEIQSGIDRVRWAEGLIRQLPVDHDGRNSWLINYGTSAGLLSAAQFRKAYEPDDYEDAFRAQPEARGVEGMVLEQFVAFLKPRADYDSEDYSAGILTDCWHVSTADIDRALRHVLAPNPVRAEQQECGAIGSQDCTYRPEGPHGEMQCTYCGAEQPEGKGALREALEKLRSYNVDIRDGRINYRPQDHIDVAEAALAAAPAAPGAAPSGVRVDDAMVERGLNAARDASDARLPRYRVVRAILTAALAGKEGVA